MDTERIDELEKLAKAASGGTWRYGNQKPSDNDELLHGMFFHTNRYVDKEDAEANGEFLIESRDAVLELCKEVRKLQALQGNYESMQETNRVLSERLLKVAQRLPAIAQELGEAEEKADEGDGDGYEACYNAAGNTRSAINGLLRDIDPKQTMEGAQSNG